MFRHILLAVTLSILGLTSHAQLLDPFDFEDELFNERLGYNPAPSRQLPPGALLDSLQYGEFDGFEWLDDVVIKVTRTADYEVFSQSWSDQFGAYATDTARFLQSGPADSFWIVREEGYFDFNANRPDTFISSRIGKRWYENGQLDSVRIEGRYESALSGSGTDEITHSFSYGPFGLTSFAVRYSEPSNTYVERTDVTYDVNGDKSGYQVFEVDGLDEELEISATITKPAANQVQYVIDDFGDEFTINQFISAAGNIDSTTYVYVDDTDTFMATLARTDDGTDPRFLEYAFISGDVDDPERIRYWLSSPVSEVDQLPLAPGQLQCTNPVSAGALVKMIDVDPGTRVTLMDGHGRLISAQTATSEQVVFHWPAVPGGIYFLVAQRAGHATRAWELIGL